MPLHSPLLWYQHSLPRQRLLPLFIFLLSWKALPAWATGFWNLGAMSWGSCLPVFNSASHPSREWGDICASVRYPKASSFKSMNWDLVGDRDWRPPPSDPAVSKYLITRTKNSRWADGNAGHTFPCPCVLLPVKLECLQSDSHWTSPDGDFS